MKKSRIIIPFATLVLSSLSLLTTWDKSIQDLFIKTLPDTKEDPKLLLINVDDVSIQNAGIFPWPRNIYGEITFKLSELGAAGSMLDFTFIDESPNLVDSDYLENDFMDETATTISMMDEGSISSEEAFQKICDAAQNIKINNDSLMQKRLASSTNAEIAFVLGMDSQNQADSDDLLERASIQVQGNKNYLKSEKTCAMPIDSLLSDGTQFGFINAYPDSDGKLRSVNLLMECNGHVLPRLGFNTILKMLKNPQIMIKKNSILLKDANLHGQTKDISIPMDENGAVILKYPKSDYYQMNGIPAWNIYALKLMEDQALYNLRYLEDSGLIEKNKEQDLFSAMEKMLEMENSLLESSGNSQTGTSFSELRECRTVFFDKLKIFLKQKTDEAEKEINHLQLQIADQEEKINSLASEKTQVPQLQTTAAGSLAKSNGQKTSSRQTQKITLSAKTQEEKDALSLKNKDLSESQRLDQQSILKMKDELSDIQQTLSMLETFSDQISEYEISLRKAQDKVSDSLCMIGVCASSTTDEYNTMEGRMPGVSAYYVLYNMILSEDFVSNRPFWWSLILAAILSFFYAIISSKLKPKGVLLLGILLCLSTASGLWLFFYLSRIYIGTLMPFASVFATFVSLTSIEYFCVSKEKAYIRNAFGKYLSDAIVEDIIANPEKLTLGGANKKLTAIFTDIRGFTTLSEKMTAPELINLLNMYLSTMSDIIMKHGGTIDKYEGDAIVAFFGSPVELPNSALNACRSALQMKKAEADLNKKLKSLGKYCDFFTRIGINTGDMVVGNLGTEGKMNYTIIGHHVNLASRLEGVNKFYDTNGIIIGENTYNDVKDTFIARPLDKIKVVGVSTPVRIYELIEENAIANESLLSFVAQWKTALNLLESRAFEEALKAFTALRINFNDKVSNIYIERCQKYISDPPPSDWDGVEQLTSK